MSSIPGMAPVKGGAIPYLTVDGAVKAADFYRQAFAAELAALQPPDPKGRAVQAGCTATMPPTDMFWGDRYGQLTDPFGVSWAINGPGKKRAG